MDCTAFASYSRLANAARIQAPAYLRTSGVHLLCQARGLSELVDRNSPFFGCVPLVS